MALLAGLPAHVNLIGEVTRLLQAYAAGDASAFDRLFLLVHDELRRIARRHLRHGARGGRDMARLL